MSTMLYSRVARCSWHQLLPKTTSRGVLHGSEPGPAACAGHVLHGAVGVPRVGGGGGAHAAHAAHLGPPPPQHPPLVSTAAGPVWSDPGLLRPLWSCDCLRTFSRCLADTADTADTVDTEAEGEEAELVARLRAVFGRYGSSCYTKHEAYQG